ncbi:MAG TPA: alpha/beta fold hydrolase [Opitutaceae bacterium]
MPVVPSSYRAPPGFSNGHVQTVFAALIRQVNVVTGARKRIEIADGDFLDLDMALNGNRRVAILSHGLEGSSRQTYVQGMARALFRNGWDVAAWNFRGCSGEFNWLLRFYHSGASQDLHVVVDAVLSQRQYERIALVGFSLGGNVTLKYLGERGGELPAAISDAVVFSVPCDLGASAARLASWFNRIYMRRFLRTLAAKIRAKRPAFPAQIDVGGLEDIRTFEEFDGRYTAPLHGFADAHDYWRKCSSRAFLPGIRVRTLLVNAHNDPFLAPSCFPLEEARDSEWLHLEIPLSGGHVGFVSFVSSGDYWSEIRTTEFLEGGAP